jgi:hypothetical protein
MNKPRYPKIRLGAHCIPIHQLLAVISLGRPLGPGEVCHHRNEDPRDFRPINLIVLSRETHAQVHGVSRMRWVCCHWCGGPYRRPEHPKDPFSRRFCSMRCSRLERCYRAVLRAGQFLALRESGATRQEARQGLRCGSVERNAQRALGRLAAAGRVKPPPRQP